MSEVLGELRATFRGHSAVFGNFACNSPEYVAGLYHFMLLSHSCSGIACGFGEGGAHRGCGWGEEGVWVRREGRIEVWLWA